jgi:protein O-mannosyl-transferase
MAKQPARPQQKQPVRQAPPAKTAPITSGPLQLHAFLSQIQLHGILIFALAFVLYANTLWHGFVQDDAIVIGDNMFTQQGVKGIGGILSKDTFFGFYKVEGKDMLVSGGRYRPFTLILFAFVYQFAGASPFAFHLLTVLLFAGTCVLLYHVLRLLFRGIQAEGDYANLVALIAAVIFTAHPIHTEAVANIKGCDEIVTLLLSLATLWMVVKTFDTGAAKWALASGAVFLLACLSKENAVTYLAVIPLALWFFRRASMRQIIRLTAPAFIGFLVFFVIRGTILHWKFGGASFELMNNPYIKLVGNNYVPFTFGEKLATIIFTLGKYVLLLIFPHPLTHDYYPRQIDLMTFGSPLVLLSLLLYAGLGYFAYRGFAKRDPISFGILYFIATMSIVSNLFFPIGTNMGERFAFMPSVGYCLIASVLLVHWMKSGSGWAMERSSTILAIVGIVGLAYAFKTITRNPVWESNEKLFFADVNTSTNSAKIRNACGGVLYDRARLTDDMNLRKQAATEAIPHLDKALEIYPNYSDSRIARGGCHLFLGNYDLAVADLKDALRLQPEKPNLKETLAGALREAGKTRGEKMGDLPGALQRLNESWKLSPKDPETARLLGIANGIGGNQAEAVRWFEQALQLAPNDASVLFDLGTAYQMSGNLLKANEMRSKAIQINPNIVKEKTNPR